MSGVQLGRYENRWFHPGRSQAWQIAWFLLGLPVLRCSFLPFSSVRVRLLRLFGAELGTGLVIKPGVRVKYPWNLSVGNDCWLGEDAWIDNLAAVRIGNNVCLSQGAYLCTGNHDWSDPQFGLIVKPISLENGSWVGARALLAPGVTLGEHAIAAAGSVVTSHIPAWEIFAGNPASFVRRRRLRATRPEGPADAPEPAASTFQSQLEEFAQ